MWVSCLFSVSISCFQTIRKVPQYHYIALLLVVRISNNSAGGFLPSPRLPAFSSYLCSPLSIACKPLLYPVFFLPAWLSLQVQFCRGHFWLQRYRVLFFFSERPCPASQSLWIFIAALGLVPFQWSVVCVYSSLNNIPLQLSASASPVTTLFFTFVGPRHQVFRISRLW